MVSHECSYDAVTAIEGKPFLHDPVEIGLGNQVLHIDLDHGDAVLLSNDSYHCHSQTAYGIAYRA